MSDKITLQGVKMAGAFRLGEERGEAFDSGIDDFPPISPSILEEEKIEWARIKTLDFTIHIWEVSQAILIICQNEDEKDLGQYLIAEFSYTDEEAEEGIERHLPLYLQYISGLLSAIE